MARRPVRPLLIDQSGNALAGGWVNVYEHGTTTPVPLWSAREAGAAVAQPLVTGPQGDALAWVDTDPDDPGVVDVLYSDSGATTIAHSGHRVTFAPFTEVDSSGPPGPPGPSADVVVVANTGAAYLIDPDVGTLFDLDVTANTNLTLGTAPQGRSIVVQLTQVGGFTVTWPVAVAWPGGTPPAVSPLAGAIDVLVFVSTGAGWYGIPAGANIV